VRKTLAVCFLLVVAPLSFVYAVQEGADWFPSFRSSYSVVGVESVDLLVDGTYNHILVHYSEPGFQENDRFNHIDSLERLLVSADDPDVQDAANREVIFATLRQFSTRITHSLLLLLDKVFNSLFVKAI